MWLKSELKGVFYPRFLVSTEKKRKTTRKNVLFSSCVTQITKRTAVVNAESLRFLVAGALDIPLD